MLRFAPSPTADMHIGDLRVAIINYIVAQQRKEDLIIRIEDMDKEKNIEGKDQEFLDLLALFNINYSQVIYQSENVRFHSAMALQLVHERKAFSCFCSPEWLNKKQKEAEVTKKVYAYDDACRNLPAELVIDNTNPFTIRITRLDSTITINDQIKGDVSFNPNEVDSFIILNQDKIPTYNFACGVDDMLSDISIIIRSDEHMSKTPKQEHIRESLKYDKKVEYAHIPVILGDNPTIKSLLEDGFLPEAILNYLVSIGNQLPQEIFTMQEVIEWFELSQLSNSPTHFDINRLRDINKKHLKNLDAKELSRYVGFADIEIGELARIYLEEVSTTKELKAKIASIFSKHNISTEFAEQIASIVSAIKAAPYFEEYDDFKKHILHKTGLDDENFVQPLRILLTKEEKGPDMAKIYKYLKNYIGEIVK